MADRIRRVEEAERSAASVDPHSRLFVGREREMEQLALKLASPASSSDFTVLHGLGGIGKTSLAVEYTHSCAGKYLAGRWQAKCGGLGSLNDALASLAGPLGVVFGPQEPAETEYRAKRVLAELRKRAHANSGPEIKRCLVILDNMENTALLSLSQTRVLPRAKWMHVVATLQLGPSDVPDVDRDAWLALDHLSDEDTCA